MLRANVNYPHPVLRTGTVDFSRSVFNDEITLKTTEKGYILCTNFSVSDERIGGMINSGILSYAVYIVCKSTMLRKMIFIDADHPDIPIDSGEVHYSVNYEAYVLAKEDIDDYYSDDFAEDYKNIHFKLKKGDIVGVGTEKRFDALFEKDIIHDASSIINVVSNDQEKYMTIDLDNSRIKVILPTDQFSVYKSMKGKKNKYPLLHATVTVPALIEAISAISINDDDELSQRPWFVTLQKAIADLSLSSGESEEFLYDHPTRTVQMLMGNNSDTALKLIDEMII